MIKLSIRNQERSKEKELKGVLDLQQEQEDGESVTLIIEDKEWPDAPWEILKINCDGTFSRCKGLPDNIGLQTDSNGNIVESEE